MTKRFSASSASRLMTCHASADLPAAIPNWVEPDDIIGGAADKGTDRHTWLEPLVALPASEMRQYAKLLTYLADLRATRRFKVLVEHTVKATWLTSQPDTQLDLCYYTQDESHVIDYKWGKIPVPIDDNAQMLYYAVCVAALSPRAKGVTVHLLQPPLDSYENRFISTDELREFMEEAQRHEREILAGDLTFGPSDHCTFCPANPHGRGAKGRPFCPVMLDILYPGRVDEDEILSL